MRRVEFARERWECYQRLSNADQERSSSSADHGRGHLSERALWDFCEFTLRVMADQIAFMEQLLDLDGFKRRIEYYVRVVDTQWSPKPTASSCFYAKHYCGANSPW